MNDTSVKTKRKVHRSPNYPAISLGDAIERTRRVYDAEKRTPASADTILTHLGYKPGAGPGYRVLSALRHYGLLEEHSGRDRLSDTAFHILTLSDTSPDRQTAVRDAAMRPTLFRQVFDHYKGEVPSDLNLRDYLIKSHSFNPDSVANFIRAFRETLEFAKLEPQAHNEVVESAKMEGFEMPDATIRPATAPSTANEQELFRSKLSPETTVRVLISGPAGPKEIDKLIRLLTLQKEVMQEDGSADDR